MKHARVRPVSFRCCFTQLLPVRFTVGAVVFALTVPALWSEAVSGGLVPRERLEWLHLAALRARLLHDVAHAPSLVIARGRFCATCAPLECQTPPSNGVVASDPEAIVNLIASILRPVRAHREASRLEEATQPELRALKQLILEHAVGLRLAVQVRDEDRDGSAHRPRHPKQTNCNDFQ